MKNKDIYIDNKTRELLKNTGIERTRPDFTRKVMDKVEIEKRLYPYKRDNTLLHVLLAIIVPVLYVFFQALTGAESYLSELNFTLELQPYIHLFKLITDNLVMDFSTPIVPLGILAIVMLLAFDRFILRSLSFK